MKGNQKFGCVFFDDVQKHTTGFCSYNGERAKRIRGTQDLDSDIVWLTNLEYDLMWYSGFSSHARFRRADFLRQNINKIINITTLYL